MSHEDYDLMKRNKDCEKLQLLGMLPGSSSCHEASKVDGKVILIPSPVYAYILAEEVIVSLAASSCFPSYLTVWIITTQYPFVISSLGSQV
jgi:hypothetical protein